ncbi:hypothetical protein CMO96_00095, partial [Candidatus Woesebacteria bacterium]|nr:hypothetical protein [Candidatus Woesebacteria bacterium]
MALQKLTQLGDQRSQEMIICKIEEDYLVCGFEGVKASDETKSKQISHQSITKGSCGCEEGSDPYYKEISDCSPSEYWVQGRSYNKNEVVLHNGSCWKSILFGNDRIPSSSTSEHWTSCSCD